MGELVVGWSLCCLNESGQVFQHYRHRHLKSQLTDLWLTSCKRVGQEELGWFGRVQDSLKLLGFVPVPAKYLLMT